MIDQLEAGLEIYTAETGWYSEDLSVQGTGSVDDFVDKLARAGVDSAYVTHSGRPAHPMPDLNDGHMTPVPDHVATLAVRNGFGYFHYVGAIDKNRKSFDGFAVGLSHSPSIVVNGATTFPQGTGIPLILFCLALKEFVSTGELPACVRWICADDVRDGRFIPEQVVLEHPGS